MTGTVSEYAAAPSRFWFQLKFIRAGGEGGGDAVASGVICLYVLLLSSEHQGSLSWRHDVLALLFCLTGGGKHFENHICH